MPGQFEAVGAKSVGLYDLCPGINICVVNFSHQARLGEVKKIEAVLKALSPLVEHGAHCAICNKWLTGGFQIIKETVFIWHGTPAVYFRIRLFRPSDRNIEITGCRVMDDDCSGGLLWNQLISTCQAHIKRIFHREKFKDLGMVG